MQNYVNVAASSGVKEVGGAGRTSAYSISITLPCGTDAGKSIVSGLMRASCNSMASDAALKPPC